MRLLCGNTCSRNPGLKLTGMDAFLNKKFEVKTRLVLKIHVISGKL
jgi:hypothetical protein